MASYQAKRRDPLLDHKTQAVIERRGKELIGAGLFALGVMVAMILASYVPDDPNWLAATDAEAQNYLGRVGASIAAPLTVIAGFGAWGIAAVFLVWGVRFMAHQGSDRAIGRLIFAPIAIALAAIYASTHVPPASWGHSFGLGGLFGDTVLGALLGILPIGTGFGLKLLSLVAALALVVMAAFVLGFDGRELRLIGRVLLIGSILAYARIMGLLGRGASGILRGAQGLQSRAHDRRAARATSTDAAQFDAPAPLQAARVEPPVAAAPKAEKPGLLARLPGVRRAMAPEPELVEPEPPAYADDAPSEDRIRARISTAIKSRVALGKPVAPPDLDAPVLRAEPPLVRGPKPLVMTPAETGQDTLAGDEDRLFAEYDAFNEGEVAPRAADPAIYAPKAVVQTPPKATAPSRQAKAERQPKLQFEERPDTYEVPPLSLLSCPAEVTRHHLSNEALEENARMLESVLDDYGVKGEIVSVRPGPVVTMYELEPAPGLKASRVIGLSDDIARSMSALSARVSTVPGRSVIGIELPNAHREKVVLREILSARDFGDSNMKLPLALGKDIGGEAVVANLAKMPHLLIAGTTGSGKSVAINTMILSLLYKLSPEECRLIMIDPKMLELSVYDGIPHLLSPVVTDPKKAVVALKWVVGEMEERYRKMSKMGVRNIEGYNGRVKDALGRGEMFSRTVQTGFDDETGDPIFETEEFAPEAMPYIVVVVDEMADLMMVAGKEIEACIQRLAQMARASGIHLIMATQRPSVDVITGTIKANFPTRISFQVTSKIDSRTILGEMGAEQLLGQGDMLYMAGGGRIGRVHGPFVSDEEVEEIVNHLKSYGPPEYVGGVVEGPDDGKSGDIDLVLGLGGNTDSEDALYDQAVAVVLRDRKVSTSYIQRKLGIGYNKAARLVEQMEEEDLVGAANHVGKREILVPEQ